MTFRIEFNLPITFVDGQVIIPVQDSHIDLLKLDTVKEFRTVLTAIAQTAVAEQMMTKPIAESAQSSEPDLDARADKIREEFQRVADSANEQLARYANVADAHTDQGERRG